MLEKILLKLAGLILVIVSIVLAVQLIIIKDEEELIIFASRVLILAIATISSVLGIVLLVAKVNKKTTVEITDEEVEEDE